MNTAEMITIQEFCKHHQVDVSFIHSLEQSGLIEVTEMDKNSCVPVSDLPQLEKMVRLYYDMDINLEGIETITYLLNRMNEMQQQIVNLNNRLRIYEDEEPGI